MFLPSVDYLKYHQGVDNIFISRISISPNDGGIETS